MRLVLAWLKANIILVISAAVCAGSLGFMVFIHMSGSAFIQRVAARSEQIKKINDLSITRVSVPHEKPDDPPRTLFICVNTPAIDALKHLYGDMKNEYENIYQYAVSINQRGHEPMLEGLFPTSTAIRAFDAREYYKSALPEFFKPFSASAPQPRLDGRPCPSADDISAAMARAETEFRANRLMSSDATLTDEQQNDLAQFKSKRLIDFYVSEAKKIHVYAQTNPHKSDYPFRLMSWATESNQPDPRDLWEAQMQLWVIQDIVHAIGQTNRVDNPEVNVMNAPIKRLLLVDLVPDYVGVTGRGAMNLTAPTSLSTAISGPGPTAAMYKQPPGGGAPGGFMPPGFGQPSPNPAPGARAGSSSGKGLAPVSSKLQDDFSIAPTGRRGNDIYDVRHVWLTLIMDSQHMPEFFESLAQTNFMTVLKLEVSGVDEYDAAKEGYIYGPGDSVKVTMLIETLWLREWTVGLMPPAVREMLGLAAPAAAANN